MLRPRLPYLRGQEEKGPDPLHVQTPVRIQRGVTLKKKLRLLIGNLRATKIPFGRFGLKFCPFLTGNNSEPTHYLKNTLKGTAIALAV